MDSTSPKSRPAPAIQDTVGSRGADTGNCECLVSDLDLAVADESGCGGMACVWVADLLHLQRQAQQSTNCSSEGAGGCTASRCFEVKVLIRHGLIVDLA